MVLTAHIDGVADGVLQAWCWNPEDAAWHPLVTVRVDDAVVGAARAERRRLDLQSAGIGDGRYGIELTLPLEIQDGAHHQVTLQLAEAPADAPDLARRTLFVPRREHLLTGRLERLAGHELVGWAWDRARPEEQLDLELLVNGERVATGRADRLRRDLARAGIGQGLHGFVFDLEMLAAPPPAGSILAVRVTGPQPWLVGTWQMDAAPAAAARALPAAQPAPGPLLAPVAPKPLGPEVRTDDPAALMAHAQAALGAGDTLRAERYASAALPRAGAAAAVILARIAEGRDDPRRAAEFWEMVPPGDPHHAERLRRRGACLLATGRPLEALAEFRAALRDTPGDAALLRAAAEAAEATCALRSALRHWAAVAAAVPTETDAAERVADLADRIAAQAAAPLRNPLLQDWPDGVEGRAGAVWHPGPRGVWLRSRGTAPFAYAATRLGETTPAGPPAFGLRLAGASGGEVAFTLDPRAAAEARTGLRMGLGLRALDDTAPAIAELLVAGLPGQARRLLRIAATARPRLHLFDLRLTPEETEAMRQGRLGLLLRLSAPVAVEVAPPRAMAALHAPGVPAGDFEDARLAARFPGGAPATLPPRRADAAPSGAPPRLLHLAAAGRALASLPGAVDAVLRQAGAPILCLVERQPGWPKPLREELAARAARDGRLRLVARGAVPAGALTLRVQTPTRRPGT
jgi:tetratricopeptide (TPR) repeat protein